jgi:ABC-type multidrug transport system ATPase subunit
MQDVSGAFRPNVLTAFMGETGAGKTTLLDVLADRKTGGKIEGDIRVNVRRLAVCLYLRRAIRVLCQIQLSLAHFLCCLSWAADWDHDLACV